MGYRLAPSDLTLDDLDGSKIKVILLVLKYVKNCTTNDVEPVGFTLDDLERLKAKVPLVRNILKTVTDTRLDAMEDFLEAAMDSIGTVRFDLG